MPVTTIPFTQSEKAFTPSWPSISVNNGTSLGRYCIDANRRVTFWAELTCGSTTAVGTNPTLDLPVPALYIPNAAGFSAMFYDDSTANTYWAWVDFAQSTTSAGFLLATLMNGAHAIWQFVTATIPITWATGDKIWVSGKYQGA